MKLFQRQLTCMSLALDCAWIAGHEKEIISSIISINRLKMLTHATSGDFALTS